MTLTSQTVSTLIDQHPSDSRFSSVALVTSGSDEIISLASGHAQRADGIPNSVETRFAQASGTKTLTAIAAARLVEEGRFEFTTKMAEILDIWPDAFGDEVTVQHLLTHTSGISDYFDEDTGDNFEALWEDVPSYSVRSPRPGHPGTLLSFGLLNRACPIAPTPTRPGTKLPISTSFPRDA